MLFRSDNDIQHNEDYIINSKGHNIFFNGFLNIVVFLACLSVMFSYLFILKEGYVFKRILFLDIIGLVLGIKILMSNFKNLKKLKEDMQLKNINKEYISLINQIGSNKIQLKKGVHTICTFLFLNWMPFSGILLKIYS